ncbi:MAG: ArsR/SmtB family transcription factor [Streptosporangiaceae bacterium]
MTARPKGFAGLDDFDAVFGAGTPGQADHPVGPARERRLDDLRAIAAWFEHSWPTTSQHLRVLQQAGLVRIELRGREHVYRLQQDRLLTVTRGWLSHFD